MRHLLNVLVAIAALIAVQVSLASLLGQPAYTLAFWNIAIPAAIGIGSQLLRNRGGDDDENRYKAMLRHATREERDPTRGQEYLEESVRAATSRAMPQFHSALQDIRENAIRRGISTGDLGTSYEGDLASAFHQNIADTAGQYAYGGYQQSRNRYLDLLTGGLDRETAERNARRDMWGNLIGSGLGAAATYYGSKGG